MHLVAAYQQDRWNDGGDNGNLGAVSMTGGASWGLSAAQPAFTICTGGSVDRASDPTVAFSSNGSIVYQAGLAFNANGGAFGGTSSVQVSTSSDGGNHWNTPVIVKEDTFTTVLNDKDWITADPTNPRKAYVVWDRLVSPSQNANPTAFNHVFAFRGPARFSQTTDGGASWRTPKIIYDPGEYNQTIDNEIVAPPAGPAAGDLLDGFTLILTKGGKGNHPSDTYYVAMLRSADGGATWSAPTIISQLGVAEASSLNGQPYRTGDVLPQFTSDPNNGNLSVVWQDGRFSSSGQPKVAFSQSTDGGKTWSTPIKIDRAPERAEAFTPQIAVSSDGTIGVTYYDTENATSSNPGNTDEFILHCHAATADCTNPANWVAGGETRFSTTGSFDMTKAPLTPTGYFTGDYEGLTTSGTTFDPFFVMAQPIATKGPTDPFSNTAG
jgi:Neuraminidase (sialidase)